MSFRTRHIFTILAARARGVRLERLRLRSMKSSPPAWATTFRNGPADCPPTRRRGPAPRNTTSSCGSGKEKRLIPADRAATEAKPRPQIAADASSRSLTSRSANLSVHEHHGLAAVQDDAILEVIADRARQHAPLDVAALADEIVGRVAMADALDVLVDDRPLVEIAG